MNESPKSIKGIKDLKKELKHPDRGTPIQWFVRIAIVDAINDLCTDSDWDDSITVRPSGTRVYTHGRFNKWELYWEPNSDSVLFTERKNSKSLLENTVSEVLGMTSLSTARTMADLFVVDVQRLNKLYSMGSLGISLARLEPLPANRVKKAEAIKLLRRAKGADRNAGNATHILWGERVGKDATTISPKFLNLDSVDSAGRASVLRIPDAIQIKHPLEDILHDIAETR